MISGGGVLFPALGPSHVAECGDSNRYGRRSKELSQHQATGAVIGSIGVHNWLSSTVSHIEKLIDILLVDIFFSREIQLKLH